VQFCFHKKAGFSLIEVLFALAVIGLAAGATASVLRNGLLGHATASDAAKALALADEQLELAGAAAPLRAGQSNGAFGRFRWHVTVADTDEPELAGGPLHLFRIEASVAWSDGVRHRAFALSSLRLAPGAP
jgi:prepilin-type N-terminal cleavage/methylation domain-containing protein